jgi:hypothetical protein
MPSSAKTASKVGLCIECGSKIAPILIALGSLTCHDCRRPGERAKPV